MEFDFPPLPQSGESGAPADVPAFTPPPPRALLPLPEETPSPVRLPSASPAGCPLLLSQGRIAIYHSLIGYDLGPDSEDRPRSLAEAHLLLFLAAHRPETWLYSPAPGLLPLIHDVDTFRATVALWADSLPAHKAGQIDALTAAQMLWDFHCVGRPIAEPEDDQKKTTSPQSGHPRKRKPSGSSVAATSRGKTKSSGDGRSRTTTPRNTAAGYPPESPSTPRKRKKKTGKPKR